MCDGTQFSPSSVVVYGMGDDFMQKNWKFRWVTVFGLAVAGVVFVSNLKSVEARPKYFTVFKKQYPKVTEAKKVKCNICHFGKKKKNRNDYGKALEKLVGKKNQKDIKKIKAAFKKAEKLKSSTKDKTFGDLLKDGKLPGKAPKSDKTK